LGRTQFSLLGPLVVRQAGVVIPVTAGKHRALLAALLLQAGRPVGADELAGLLWESKTPQSARATLQTYVGRLRALLEQDGDPVIVTEPAGYRIDAGPDELDVAGFESALAAGRAAMRAESWATASAVLAEGLALWRGQPLAGVPSDVLAEREVPRLSELRTQALEARIEADLRLGRHAEVILELRQLTAAEPLRERLHALLMTALYRDGQQSGALEVYQDARATLVGELGVEPGQDLRQLQAEGRGGGCRRRPVTEPDGRDAVLAAARPRHFHRQGQRAGQHRQRREPRSRGRRGCGHPGDRRDARHREDHPGRARSPSAW
jgi:DNA-binding SARP family transcriptional activator